MGSLFDGDAGVDCEAVFDKVFAVVADQAFDLGLAHDGRESVRLLVNMKVGVYCALCGFAKECGYWVG